VGTPQRNRVLARRRLHRDQRARLPAMRRHRHDAARSGRRQPSDTIRPVAPHEPGCPARQSASGQTGVAEHREHLRRRHVRSIPTLGLGYQPKARGCGRACLRAVVLSSRKTHYPRQELITLVCLDPRLWSLMMPHNGKVDEFLRRPESYWLTDRRNQGSSHRVIVAGHHVVEREKRERYLADRVDVVTHGLKRSAASTTRSLPTLLDPPDRHI
jgi:hypothetical protein